MVDSRDVVTDVVPSGTIRLARQVSWDGKTVEALAVVEGRDSVASFKRRIRLSSFQVELSLDLAEFEGQLPTKAAADFAEALDGGQLTATTTAAVRKAIDEHHPAVADAWKTVETLVSLRRPDIWAADGVPVAAYERDAVGLALKLAGMDSGPLADWNGDRKAPFLRGIKEYRVYEDAAIVHDTTTFGLWKHLAPDVVGFAEFQHDGRRLTVVNANRTAIENSLGCDLVYYAHDYDAYVPVQHKRLTKSGKGDHHFRPDQDANFAEELKRMRAIAAPAEAGARPEDYRLGDGFCFIKFCLPTTLQTHDSSLSKGMYLPLDYFDALDQSDQLRGPLGGKSLTFDNVGRYLINTAFVTLVEHAWVGARGLTTEQLTAVLQESLEAKHSLVVAQSRAA